MRFRTKVLLFAICLIALSFASSGRSEVRPERAPAAGADQVAATARLGVLGAWAASAAPAAASGGLTVGLVADRPDSDNHSTLAYREVLAEEGWPFTLVTLPELAALPPAELKARFWALIIPEGLSLGQYRQAEPALRAWLADHGGQLFFALGGAERSEPGGLLSLAGLRPREANQPTATFTGPWLFPARSCLRAWFDPGLFKEDRLQVPGYPPYATNHLDVEAAAPDLEVLATTLAPSGETVPLATLRRYAGGGAACFVNAPLGLLKARANDDFPLRGFLKHFLIAVARAPRLANAPQGIGGLVLNLHLCARRSLVLGKQLLDSGAFTPELPLSIVASAGPDNLTPGDAQGVDALAWGQPFLKQLERYGRLGSHGGWSHAYWGLSFDAIPDSEKKRLIDQNFAAINQIAATAATEYAAPNGRHSAAVSDYLAGWGVEAIAFPAAFNSPPTRVWFAGRPDLRYWHFGYTSTGFGNCPENMLAAGCPPQQVAGVIGREVSDQAAGRREIRLFYTHTDSLARYPDIWEELKTYLLAQKKAGRLTVRTMTDYAEFLNRHQAARLTCRAIKGGYEYLITSPLSLKEITLALPVSAGSYLLDATDGVWSFAQEQGAIYATITGDVRHARMRVKAAALAP